MRLLLERRNKTAKGYSFIFGIILEVGFEFDSTSCPAWSAMQPSLETKPTGTHSRFVSCIQLHTGTAAVAAVAVCLAECCHHMKEVANAQDASDHDGR
jgi:hypothetical protein